jgi:hypothetical protein
MFFFAKKALDVAGRWCRGKFAPILPAIKNTNKKGADLPTGKKKRLQQYSKISHKFYEEDELS